MCLGLGLSGVFLERVPLGFDWVHGFGFGVWDVRVLFFLFGV